MRSRDGKGRDEMMSDRVRDRALLLSQGLFGAPAAHAQRDREARAAQACPAR
jgi:hypothetical protein